MKNFIFVVEDDSDDLEMLRNAFSQIGWLKVMFFLSPTELLRMLTLWDKDNLPALLVIDYFMPRMNGDEFSALLAKDMLHNKIPRVAWTQSPTGEMNEKLAATGVTRVFTKPSTFSDYRLLAEEFVTLATQQ